MKYHVAQFNVARMVAPLEDPQMRGFVIRLDAINALAERSPGFVWRHQGENGNSTGERPYDDATLINLSVWETPEQWHAYTFGGAHREVMKRRGSWFERHDGTPYSVMWWVPAGHIPTVTEAVARLEHLRALVPIKPRHVEQSRLKFAPVYSRVNSLRIIAREDTRLSGREIQTGLSCGGMRGDARH